VNDHDESADRYLNDIRAVAEKVVVGKVPSYTFMQKWRGVPFDRTSIVAFDVKKRKFAVFSDVNSHGRVGDLLRELIDGKLESEMKFDGQLLFTLFPTEPPPENKKSAVKFALICGIGILGVLIVMVWFMSSRNTKIE
jgi:hypothetical protein